MSTPIEQMILDAKRLANRLKEKETMAGKNDCSEIQKQINFRFNYILDVLLNETERVNYQLDSMRHYTDDVNSFNILARERSNTDMIQIINQEHPQIREIQQENRQLKVVC